MTMHPATSTNVLAVGYEPSAQTIRVQFRSGGTTTTESRLSVDIGTSTHK